MMRSRDFCYWLQGYFELAETEGGDATIPPKRLKAIKDHLSMVFVHEIDPSFGDDNPKLDAIHNQFSGNHSKPLMKC